MVKTWDDRLKRLAGIRPRDYVQWLLPEADLVGIVSLELKTLTRTVNTDVLIEVRLGGKKALLHIEFQRQAKSNIAQRIWEYNVLATLAHNCPVYSFIIYLTPGCKIPEVPLIWGLPQHEAVHVFHFTNIKLWELPIEALKRTGLKGLLPLCLLARDGAQRAIAKEVIEGVKDNDDLLTLALTLASMVLTSETDQQWLEGEVAMLEDIVRDTWFYQKILKEGLERGIQEGREQGREKGREEGREEGREVGREEATIEVLRLVILDTVQEFFPVIVELTKKRLEVIQDPVLLRRLNTRLVAARTAEEAERVLTTMDIA